MKKYLYIAFGGILGTYIRFIIKQVDINAFIPASTLIVNVIGSFLIGLIITIMFKKLSSDIKLGITTGFLGALTTFSTLCKETFMLFETGNYYTGIIYILLSAILGLGAALLGVILGRKLNCKCEGGAK